MNTVKTNAENSAALAVFSPALCEMPGQHGLRAVFARRAACGISDLAVALATLVEDNETAKLTLLRRIESLVGVVLAAMEEEMADLQFLENEVADIR